jgi:hypothetical protein
MRLVAIVLAIQSVTSFTLAPQRSISSCQLYSTHNRRSFLDEAIVMSSAIAIYGFGVSPSLAVDDLEMPNAEEQAVCLCRVQSADSQ